MAESFGAKRALIKDVDISTMHSMRDQGMSNKEIANALGCSIAAIYHHIGGVKKHKKSDESYPPETHEKRIEIPKHVKPAEQTIPESSLLKLVSKKQEMKGDVCTYSIDMLTGDIEIKDGVVNGILDLRTLSLFINELGEIKKMLLPVAIESVNRKGR